MISPLRTRKKRNYIFYLHESITCNVCITQFINSILKILAF